MRNKKKLRIFVGPCEIAGYYSNLTKGLQDIGYEVDFITYYSHRFCYGGETHHPLLLRAAKWFNQHRGVSGRPFFLKIIYALPGEFFLSLWGFKAIFSYDVYIFSFGRTLLPLGIDLLVLRLLRKKVISNLAHGSEARPPFVNGSYQTVEINQAIIEGLVKRTKKIARLVSWHFRYASIIIGAPFSTSQNARNKYINHFALGIPFNGYSGIFSSQGDVNRGSEESNVIRILHSPSNLAVKGSKVIINAVEGLKKKGHRIELVLIHDRPVSSVLAEIKKCDFVVDQIYSDTPMAGFATEAAWYGKPAVVAGYGLEQLKGFVPEGMWPPSKTCCPDVVEYAIEELILDHEQRNRLGVAAQVFVHEKWDSLEVAKRFQRLIEDDIPECWWIEPRDIVYLEGGGQSEEKTKKVIRGMVSEYGVDALQLSHRPDLEAAFLEFAEIDTGSDIKNASSIH
jgi:hypothetical protein